MTITDTAHLQLTEMIEQPENTGKHIRVFSRGFG